MITDPCNCGIKPSSHAHLANNNDEVIFWKGLPITRDQIESMKSDEEKTKKIANTMKENKLHADDKDISFKGDSVFLMKCLEYLIGIARQSETLKAWVIWYCTPDEWKPRNNPKEKQAVRQEISKILVKWGMGTKQVAIMELAKLVEESEKRGEEKARKEIRQILIDNIITTLENYKAIPGEANWNDVIKIIRSFKDEQKRDAKQP